MKQGKASSSGMAATKVEPTPHAVAPKETARIGIRQIGYSYVDQRADRGYKAPKAASSIHHCGSQGKH